MTKALVFDPLSYKNPTCSLQKSRPAIVPLCSSELDVDTVLQTRPSRIHDIRLEILWLICHSCSRQTCHTFMFRSEIHDLERNCDENRCETVEIDLFDRSASTERTHRETSPIPSNASLSLQTPQHTMDTLSHTFQSRSLYFGIDTRIEGLDPCDVGTAQESLNKVRSVFLRQHMVFNQCLERLITVGIHLQGLLIPHHRHFQVLQRLPCLSPNHKERGEPSRCLHKHTRDRRNRLAIALRTVSASSNSLSSASSSPPIA